MVLGRIKDEIMREFEGVTPHLFLRHLPPVGDDEVPPAQQDGQCGHHHHEGQDGPEVREVFSLVPLANNYLQ